jgi:hypothetical protein
MIESISYTETGKPNLKLVSKEFAYRELRRMLGGDAEQASGRATTSLSTRMASFSVNFPV